MPQLKLQNLQQKSFSYTSAILILSVRIIDVTLRGGMPPADETQRLWHHGMNLRRGSLINRRLDGEARRDARHGLLVGGQCPMVVRSAGR